MRWRVTSSRPGEPTNRKGEEPEEPECALPAEVDSYDISTRCLIDDEQQRGDRGSRNPDLVANEDGSVDLSFGPTAPADRESNWIQTIADRHWFAYFRLYGPLESSFDRTWKLVDITPYRS